MIRAMVFTVALGAFACAPASSSDDENAQGALTGESAATAKVRFGTFEYRYPGRDGLVKRLVLKEGAEGAVGTFERTEWKKEGRRLATRKTTGTFTTSTKPMPEFTRTLLHFKTGDGQVETYRYRNDDDGRLQLQIDREGAPRTEVRLVEAADGTKALVGDCKATAVDDMTIFEESFSVDEYPSVDFYRAPDNGFMELWIGSSAFSTKDGDAVTITPSAEGLDARVVRDGDLTHVVRVRGTTGEVVSTENGQEIHVATLRCKAR
ncbi:MAG: hypothetical protein IPG50_31705 [Myxococcales bacterium]|nr:hypothetical protein [Myxococcales bacterium]